VANVAVGFDLLGFPVESVGDEIEVRRVEAPGVRIVDGGEGLPTDPAKNTATVGLVDLARELDLSFGFEVAVRKGIPLGSGMGGSAASSVGALVAANALLQEPVSRERLLRYALMGEFVASGASHPDNVAPCLYGGLTLTRSIDPVEVIKIPVPRSVLCVLVHPHARLDTRTSRGVLKRELALGDHVRQSLNLASVLAGCYTGSLELIRGALADVVVEPQRAPLIKGFAEAKAAALAAGALGCSISGSGPSVFAWVDSSAAASAARDGMVAAFARAGVGADAWISRVSDRGARVVKLNGAPCAP
jgi:homoserine kinase